MKTDKAVQRMRLTAYGVPIKAIIDGNYIKEEGEFAPNYIEIGTKKVSRVNIIGIVVSLEEKETSSKSLVIDDGSAKISLRGFEQIPAPNDIVIGDIIKVIGRPREFGSEKYIVPEIIKKTNENWMRVRKLEIEKEGIYNIDNDTKKEDVVENVIDELKKEENEKKEVMTEEGVLTNHEKIIDYIKQNDSGKGVEIEDILKAEEIVNCEKIIENMLKEGELFETAPGRLKVLE